MRISGLIAAVTADLDGETISALLKFQREIAPIGKLGYVTERVAATWSVVPWIAATAVHRGSNEPLRATTLAVALLLWSAWQP